MSATTNEFIVSAGVTGSVGDTITIGGKDYEVGVNAFASFVEALKNITADTTAIVLSGDVTEDIPAEALTVTLAQDLEIKGEGVVTLNNGGYKRLTFTGADVKISGIELVAPRTQIIFGDVAPSNVEIDATATVSAYVVAVMEGSTVNVLEGGKFFTTGEVMRVEGTLNASGNAGFDAASETLTADNRQTVAHYSWIYGTENLKDNYNTIYSQLRLIGADSKLNLDNARLEVGKTVAGEWLGNPVANGVGWIKLDGAMTLDNGSVLLASVAVGKDGYGLTLSEGAEFTVANGSEAELSAGISNMGTVNVDGGTLTAGTNFAGAGTQAPNCDVVNSGDINVTNDGVFAANNVSNVTMVTLSGLAKGTARTIQVSFIPAAGNVGAVMNVDVAANATSVTISANSLADGSYTVTYVDGGQAFMLSGLVEVCNGKINVNGGIFTADSVAVGKGTFDIDGASSVNVADLDGVANVKGGTLTDSVIGGVVAVTGDTTFEGTNDFSKIWVSGGTLTVDGDLVTKAPYPAFFVIGNDEKVNATEKGFYNGFIGTEAGEMIVNGSYTAEEGVVGNGGKLTVNGEMTANCLYLRGGETTVAEGGSLTGIVWGGVDAGASLVVDGGTFGTKKADGLGSFSNAGTFTVKGSSTLQIVNFASGTIEVADGTSLTDTVIAGKGTVKLNGTVNFYGTNSIAAVENTVFDIVVNKNASLVMPRTSNVWGYGRDVTVYGVIEDATALESLDGVTLSLKADIASGFSIGGTGTHTLTVEDAYVDLGKSSWKNAYGTYTWSFKNSYVKVGTFADTKAGVGNASWVSTFDDSVLVSDTYFKTGKGMEVNFTNGSVATIKGSMRMDGVLNIDSTSSVSVNGYFNNKVGVADEHSDILGTVNVAGTMNIKGSGPVELIGGSVNVLDGGTLNLVNDNGSRLDVLVDADSELNIDGNFTAGTITNNGAFAISGESTVDVGLIKGNDVTVSGTLKDSNISFESFDCETGNAMVDGELVIDGGTFKNVQFRADEGEKVTLEGNIVAAGATQIKAVNGAVVVNGSFTSTLSEASSIEIEGDDSTLTINEGSYAKITGGFYLNGGTTVINGELTADADKKALVRTDADVDTAYATLGGTYAADVTLNNAYVWNAMISINNADSEIIVDNSRLDGWMSFDITAGTLIAQNGSFVNHQAAEGWTRGSIGADAAIILTDGSIFDAAKTNLTFAGSISVDATSSFIANTLTGEGTITIDATGFTEGINKVIDLNETASREGKVTISGLEDGTQVYYLGDGDVILSNADLSKLYVSSEYAGKKFGDDLGDGKFFGINAFADFDSAVELLPDNNSTIYLFSDAEMNADPRFKLNVVSGDGAKHTLKINSVIDVDAEFAKEVNIDAPLFMGYYNNHQIVVNGDLKGGFYNYTGSMTFNNSKITDSYDNSNIGGVVTINGDGSWTLDNAQAENLKFINVGRSDWLGQGILNLNDTVVKAIAFDINSSSADAKSQINVVNSTLATVLNEGLFGNITVGANGEINLTNSDMYVVGILTNNGAVNVTGESTLKINSATGEAVKFIDGTLTDSNVQGTVNAYGETVFRGTNNIKVLETGRDSNYTDVTTTQILGNFTTTNMLTGTVNADSKVYIGAADEERTTAYFGQLGGFGKVAVENADVTYGYAFIRNNFDVKNSTLENKSVNTYFAGNAKVVVDNSTWTTGAYTAVGSYGGYMWGNADVTIQNGSTLSAGNFDIENGGSNIVKVTVDNAALEASSRITLAADTSLTLAAGAAVETALVTNYGSITIDCTSLLTAGTITNNGTITVDAAGFDGTWVKVVDVNSAITGNAVALENGKGYYLSTAADGDIYLYKSPDTVYVSSDYNSSTEGWGYTHFANYDSAVAYIKANAKKATMVIEKTTTVSGNCFQDKTESLGVDLTNAVIVKDGAVVGNAQSKWDMTYSVTLEGGAIFQSARGTASGIGNTHIKNVLTIGDGSEKRAEVRFVNGLSGINYQTMSIALLGALNRKLVTNNALVEVGDLGINGTASFTDTIFTIEGIFAIKGNGNFKTTMTDSTMTVKGHNLMNENTYYSTVGTILSTLTMDNSSITVDDGAEDTAAEKVWLGYTGNVARTLTLTNGSSITVEKGTEVEVANTVTAADSTITVGTLNAGTTKYGGTNNFNFNQLEKGKVYWAVLYDADGSVLEVIERSSTSGSTFSPKFSAQPAGSYKAVCYADAELTQIHQEKTYSFTAVGTLTLTNSDIVAETITLAGGNLTMDYKSSVTFTGIEGGYITVSDAASYVDNADVADGTYKLLDYTGTAAMTADDYKVILNDAWHDNYLVFNNDLYLTDQVASFIRVDAALKDVAIGTVLEDGSIVGFNAFATTKEAYIAARNLGGEITIDLNKAGTEKIDDGTIGLGDAGKNGIYTITGGTVNTTSYGLSFANTETTVKFKDATFKLAKLYVANAGGSLIVDNSVIGTAAYSGHSTGWVTAGKGSISINNSVFGANFSNYTAEELAAMPRSASDVKAAVEAGTYKYWAFGANNSGPHMGTAGEIAVAGSTLSTSWISLIDRAEMVLDNSVLYYGAAISIGAGQVDNSYGPYNSNEIGWDAQIWWNPVLSSAAGYREGEVATLTVKDSIVRNIGNGNGNSGAHVQVGGSYVNGIDKSVTGDCAGVLNIINSEFYTTPYDADGNAVAKPYDMIVVKSNGTVNMTDSKLTVSKLVNDGSFNVKGASALDIAAVSGNGWINMDSVTLDAETDIKGGKVRFVNGESTLTGVTVNADAFQVGFGAYQAKDARETVADIVVNVTGNSYIHAMDADYYGWVGTGWFESDEDKAAAMTDARYTLNISNSVAEFGYFHVSTDGILNVTGNAAEKKTYTGVDYSYYTGRTMINGVATFDNVDVLALFTNVSCDNGTENGGKLVIKNGAEYVSWADSTSTQSTFQISKTGQVEVDNATLDVRHNTLIAEDASLTVKNNGIVTANAGDYSSITNHGTITLNSAASLTARNLQNYGTVTLDSATADVTKGEVLGDVVVKDSTFTAEQLALNGCYIIPGFQIQDKDREVTLVFFKEGSSVGGRTFTATVKAGEDFARFIDNTIRDGEYDVTAVDGNESFIVRYNADDGDFNVYGNSSVSVKELTGKITINENAVLSKSEVKSGTVAVIGNAEMAGTNTLPNMYIAGTNADGSAATVVVDENSTLNASIVSVGGTEGKSDFDKHEYFGGYYNNVAGAMDIAGTFNTEALALYKDGKMTVSGTVNAPEFYLRDASAVADIKQTGAVTAVFVDVTGTMDVAGTLTIKGARGEHDDDVLGIGGKLSVNGGTINSNREITVSKGGELDIANGNLIFSDLNGGDGAYNGKLTAVGSVNVTGESVVKIDTLAGTINVDDADLTGYVSGGTLNITGESTIGEGFKADKFIFGSLEDSVNAAVDVTGWKKADFAAMNGTVTITGKMAEDGSNLGLAPMLVSGLYNNNNQDIRGDISVGGTTVNVAEDAYVKAYQVYISETGAVNKHTLNVYGELEATSIFNKYNGELNVYGKAAANYLQVAGNVTVTGKDAQLNLAGVGSNGAAKVGLDDGSSKFTISNGAKLDADGVVLVGYNSDRNGEMIVDNATVDASAGITVAADSTFTIKGTSTVKAAVTGNISLAGNVTLTNDTAITITNGDVTADGDVEMKHGAITGATNFTVKGILSLSNVDLPTNVGESITLVEGKGSFGGLSINGDTVVDNALFFVNGNNVEFYNVTYGAEEVTLDSVAYTPMSGEITSVAQQEGTYSFTVTPEIAGSIGDCDYSTSVYDANGKEIATAAGLTVTITDEKLLNSKLNFKVTVTDELGSDFAITTDAFTADVKDYTGPLFTAAPAAVVENGKLQLSWEAFDAFGLDKYIITINGKKTTIDAYEKMTFGQNAIAGTNIYSIVAVDKNGNTSTVEGSSYVLSPAGNISGNAVTQIVGFDAARGAVGYIANEGVEAPVWKGIWEWGTDSSTAAVAVGNFSGSSADHAGLLFYNEETFAFGAWTDITDPSYGYVELGNAGSAVEVKAIGNFDGNDSDDILVEKEDGSIGIMTDVKKYTAITSGDAVELAGAGSFGAANGLDSIVVEKNGEFQLWNTDDVASGKWNATKIMNADNQQLLDITGNWEVSAIGDFKGDGIDDIIMTAENGYSFLLNDGKTDSVEWSGAISPDFEVAGVGDYNGDGTEDLLLREMTSGWGGLGYWNGGNAGAWVDLNARIETSDEDGHSGKFSVITVVK